MYCSNIPPHSVSLRALEAWCRISVLAIAEPLDASLFLP
jgi:hypothetical protein